LAGCEAGGIGAGFEVEGKGRSKVNYPTSAKNRQIWGTREDTVN